MASDGKIWNPEIMSNWGCAFMFVFLFFPMCTDHMVNRDPSKYVDEYYQLRAAWAGDTFSLCPTYSAFYALPDFDRGTDFVPEQIHGVEDLVMNEKFITGRCEEGAFVVDRSDHKQYFYPSAEARDAALEARFSTSIGSFEKPPPGSTNPFYPYNYIYYASVLGVYILFRVGSGLWKRRRSQAAAAG